MPRLTTLLLLGIAALPFTAQAADPAAALLDLAAEHYAQHGRERALDDFSRDRRFVDGALYVFCVDGNGVMRANGGFPGFVGMNLDRFEIGGERELARRMQTEAMRDGAATVDYVWLNPSTGRAELKHTRLRRLGRDICGVGSYTPVAPDRPTRRR